MTEMVNGCIKGGFRERCVQAQHKIPSYAKSFLIALQRLERYTILLSDFFKILSTTHVIMLEADYNYGLHTC